MKKILINITTIIIIVSAVIFLQHRFFPTVVETLTHTSDTLWKDSLIVEYIPKSYPVYIDKSRTDTVVMPVDSAVIIASYIALHQKFYSVYHYNDTLKDDTLAFIGVQSEISQNKPLKYTLNYFDRTPSVVNNTTNIYAQNELFLGLEVGQEELSANLLYKSKKGYMFGIGYDPIRSNVQIKGYVKVSKLKFW